MPLDIIKPEHFVNLTREEVKRIIQDYILAQVGREIRLVSLDLGNRDNAATIYFTTTE